MGAVAVARAYCFEEKETLIGGRRAELFLAVHHPKRQSLIATADDRKPSEADGGVKNMANWASIWPA
jgi:hypothetical protein